MFFFAFRLREAEKRFVLRPQWRGLTRLEEFAMKRKIVSTALAAILAASLLLPQDNSEEEDQVPPLQHQVVVTATRLETPMREIASSVTVISRQELERMKKTSVLEALQDALGLTVVQSGPPGSAASVFLRGANSEHTLVLLDGVELNDPISPARSFDLAHLTLETVERIEILRGPQSPLYGSDALSGVVNIITRKGEGTHRLSLSSLAGSYATVLHEVSIGGRPGNFHYYLGASLLQSSGFSAASAEYEGNSERDGYRNLTLSGRIGYQPKETLGFDLVFRRFETRTEVDNFGGAFGDDPNNVQEYNSLFLRGEARSLLMANRWEQKLGISIVDYDRHHQNPQDPAHPFDQEKGYFNSRLFKLDWQNTLFLHEANTLIFGVERQQEEGESEYHSETSWGSFTSIFSLRKAWTTGIYIQDQARLAQKLFAALGVRVDFHSEFGPSFTFRFAPAWLMEKTRTKLKATLGTGFKAPSLYQLFAPATLFGPIGNENLRPERTTGWDVGIEQQLFGGRAFFEVIYFRGDYKDLIQFDFLQGYTNIGKAVSRGFEILAQAQPHPDIMIKLAFTRTEARDENSGAALLRRPRNKFSAMMNLPFTGKGSIHLSLLRVGEREDIDFSSPPYGEVTLPAYTLLNAVLSYHLVQNVQIFLRLDNIFNTRYEMVKGYGTPGFSFSTGVNISLPE